MFERFLEGDSSPCFVMDDTLPSTVLLQVLLENEDGDVTDVAKVTVFGTVVAGTNMSELKKGG